MNGNKQMNNLKGHGKVEASLAKSEEHLKEQRSYNLSSHLKEVSWLKLLAGECCVCYASKMKMH